METGLVNNGDDTINERALADITLIVDPCNYGVIAAATNAKDVWDALMRAYGDTGLTRKVELLKQLVNMRF